MTSSDALPMSYRRLVSGDLGILGKNPTTALQDSNRTYGPLMTSLDALPMSYRRLVRGDSEILGKNLSAPFSLQELNLQRSNREVVGSNPAEEQSDFFRVSPCHHR